MFVAQTGVFLENEFVFKEIGGRNVDDILMIDQCDVFLMDQNENVTYQENIIAHESKKRLDAMKF